MANIININNGAALVQYILRGGSRLDGGGTEITVVSERVGYEVSHESCTPCSIRTMPRRITGLD